MNGFGGGGFGGGSGGGFDWNGNGSRDSFDNYMDYKLSSDDKGSGGGPSGGGNGGGDGCLVAIGWVAIILFLLYMFGGCS